MHVFDNWHMQRLRRDINMATPAARMALPTIYEPHPRLLSVASS